MNKIVLLLSFAAILFVLSSCKIEEGIPQNPHLEDADHTYEIPVIYSSMGEMRLWLSYQTPNHRKNFLELVGREFYDGLLFHRVIDDFVIQGGDPDGTGAGGPGYEIGAEIKTGLRHEFGALAAARLGDQINPRRRSSGSQFYIVEGREGAHFLDGSYSVFGQIVHGTDVLEAIGAVETGTNDKPVVDVVMDSVRVEFYTRAELNSQYGFELADY